MLDTTCEHSTYRNQPMMPPARNGNNTAANRGKPGAGNFPRASQVRKLSKQDCALAKYPSKSPIISGNDRWYCWRCWPRTEYRVYLELLKLELAVYLPHILDYQSELAFVPVIKLAFPGYGFVALDSAAQKWPSPNGADPWHIISRTIETEDDLPIALPIPIPPGVIECLQLSGRPSDGVIVPSRGKNETDRQYLMRRKRDFDQMTDMLAIPSLAKGDAVCVLEGPFTSFEGLCSGDDGVRVKVLLSVFGRQATVDWTAAQ